MKKLILLLVVLLSFLFVDTQAQSWIVKDSILVFPDGFASWLKRHNGGIDLANPGQGNSNGGAIGTIGTNQGVDLFDFNKDGLPDLTFQLFPSNNITREYLKGIFIQNTNGKFVLDTNYVIKAKGDMWLGGFGDFNGDGLNDYHFIIQNYHGADSNRKYSPEMINDNWPEKVFINNGKGFDTLTLDVDNLNVESTYIADIDKDGADEIIATDRGPDFIIVYKYDKSIMKFIKINRDLSALWGKRFERWVSTEKPLFNVENEYDQNGFSLIINDSTNSKELNEPDWQPFNYRIFTYVKYNFNTKKLDTYRLNRDSIFIPIKFSKQDKDDYYRFVIHEKKTAQRMDIDKNGEEEIVVGGYYMNNYTRNNKQRFAYGWKVLGLNGKDLTSQFFKNDGIDRGTELWPVAIDIDETAEGLELIPGTWGIDSKYYIDGSPTLGYYYKIVNGKFEVATIRDIKHENGKKLDSTYFKTMNLLKYPNYKKNKTGILMYDFSDIKRTSIIYQVSCADATKPTLDKTSYIICGSDSTLVKLTNFAKTDSTIWYVNGAVVATNIDQKAFKNADTFYVKKIDVNGCIKSSDPIVIKKFNLPSTPTISRDTINNLVSSAALRNTWYKDGVKISDTTQKFKPTTNGIYTATTTQNSCTSALSQGYYYLTNAVANLSNGEYFKISPNPTSGELNIHYKISSFRNINISVFDINGRAIFLNKKVESGSKVNLGSISKGNYIIQVKDGAGRLISSQKLVKE